VFAAAGDAVFTAVDAKPKRTTELRRLENVRQNPRVALLADHYDDADWTALWWVRADGSARVLDAGEPDARRGLTLLRERYPQYRDAAPPGPVLAIAVERWSGWRARSG
jgi:PPOX class probable F420-dependent enzyme